MLLKTIYEFKNEDYNINDLYKKSLDKEALYSNKLFDILLELKDKQDLQYKYRYVYLTLDKDNLYDRSILQDKMNIIYNEVLSLRLEFDRLLHEEEKENLHVNI